MREKYKKEFSKQNESKPDLDEKNEKEKKLSHQNLLNTKSFENRRQGKLTISKH